MEAEENPDKRTDDEFLSDANRWPPPLLVDMRGVFNGSIRYGTPGQMSLKRLLKDDPKEFLSQMNALEKAYQATCKAYKDSDNKREAKKGAQSSVPTAARDEGAEKALDLIRRLLGREG